MAILCKTNGQLSVVTPSAGVGGKFTLEELKNYVGGYIEIVRLVNDNVLVCNEEGKLLGLPYNPITTNELIQKTIPGDTLVGNVLILLPEEMGD